ncbi:MAG: hypothetical protein RID91_13615 [Azospirillaceae bacterium]
MSNLFGEYLAARAEEIDEPMQAEPGASKRAAARMRQLEALGDTSNLPETGAMSKEAHDSMEERILKRHPNLTLEELREMIGSL